MAAKAILIPLVLFFISSAANADYRVLSIQSISIAPYELAVAGFEHGFGASIERVTLSGLTRNDATRYIRDYNPDLIFAVGRDALLHAKVVDTIPVVFCMILNPEAVLGRKENARGISMYLSPEAHLSRLLNLFPGIRSVGLLYDPAKSGVYVKGAKQVALEMSVELIAKPAMRTEEVFSLIDGFRNRVDFFWMLPDTTVVTPDTFESILAFSFESGIAILAFAEKYVRSGATVSISIDAYDIGRQSGEMAKRIASGTPVTDIANEEARNAKTAVNSRIAGKLGIPIDQNAIKDIIVIK